MSDYNKPYNSLEQYVPQYLQNNVSSSLLTNIFDKFLTYEEAQKFYGVIGDKTGNIFKDKPYVYEEDTYRSFNALGAVIVTKHGAEEEIFSFKDFLNKCETLGLDTSNFRTWGSVQSFNFCPPIDIDKFINFKNYVWVQNYYDFRTNSWNNEGRPEYYTIAKPKFTDSYKISVDVATTENIFLNGTTKPFNVWTIEFTSPNYFNILSSTEGLVYENIELQQGYTNILTDQLSFIIKRGDVPFQTGDKIEITYYHLTSLPPTINYLCAGNGFIFDIKSLLSFGTIDGVKLQPLMRILVKNQTNTEENGIYIVSSGDWSRAPDDIYPDNFEVYVRSGESQDGLWTYDGIFTLTANNSLLSTWSEENYWVHIDDLTTFNISAGSNKVTQALRPIIEYDRTLVINSECTKTKFNQIPLFNLFYHDGTPVTEFNQLTNSYQQIVSSIFYYQEDEKYPVDVELQRRVVKDSTYIFAQGLTYKNRLVFYKKNAELGCSWEPGVKEKKISNIKFSNSNQNNFISSLEVFNETPQTWIIKYLGQNNWSITGSKSGKLTNASNINFPNEYNSEYLTFQINGNINDYNIGDYFEFNVLNKELPIYAIPDADGAPMEYENHPSADIENKGSWLIPMQFYKNPEVENRHQLGFGDLHNHFVDVIKSQIEISGSPFGINNYRQIDTDPGLGGLIKTIDNRFNLFVGLMNQKNLTPTTLLNFIEHQYSIALNSLSDYVRTYILDVISLTNTSFENSFSIDSQFIKVLFNEYEKFYAERSDITGTFFDTTSPIKNWTITLPMLGLIKPVQPSIVFDDISNSYLMRFHDGHLAPLFSQDILLEQQLVASNVLRYDGTYSQGYFIQTLPAGFKPYKGQLWYDSDNIKLYIYNVNFEGPSTPVDPQENQYWYNRETDVLKKYFNGNWQISTDDLWTEMNIENILNSMFLYAEQKLYDYCELNVLDLPLNVDIKNSNYNNSDLEFELSKFAIVNGLDPQGSNYINTDAFTWNYSKSTILSTTYNLSPSYARWFDIYNQYFKLKTGVEVHRPDLEPWKLFGYSTKNEVPNWSYDWFNTVYKTPVITVKGICTSNSDLSFNSILTENPSAAVGDIILLVGQNNTSENGFYKIASSSLIKELTISINNGEQTLVNGGVWKGSYWEYISSYNTFVQIRKWNKQIWDDILLLHPDLKLCVNPYTDFILPPYVNYSLPESTYALITNLSEVVTPNIQFEFGQNSPVEYVWKQSLEYNYGLTRAVFKKDPINFLTKTWGFQTFNINGLDIDRISGNLLSHKLFTLHGETRNVISSNNSPISMTSYNSDFSLILEATNFIDDKILFTNSELKIRCFIGEQINVSTFNIIGLLIKENGTPFIIGDKIKIDVIDSQINATIIWSNKILYNGLNQSYVNLLRYNSFDLKSINNTALRNWTVQLGYLSGSLLDTSLVKIASQNYKVNSNSYNILLKKNEFSKNSWIHALRVQVVGIGEDRILAGNEIYIPSNKGEKWIFRVENYIPKYPKIKHYAIKPNSQYITFNALEKMNSSEEWHIPYEFEGGIISNLPLYITGIQNLIDFIYSYTEFLSDDGWKVGYGDTPEIDPETGRALNWQLEIEKFINNLYKGVSAGTGLVFNPFIKRILLETPKGLVSNFSSLHFDDIDTAQIVYDIVGDTIDPKALLIVRNDKNTEISSVIPIFGAHCNITYFEHCILFNNYIDMINHSGLLYDPFLGLKVSKLLISGKRQNNDSMRPTFGGYYLNNNETKKNLTASIDDFNKTYDSLHVFENEERTKHALSIFGFHKKDYFHNLDVMEKSEFDFWRGLINAKGTQYAFNAFLNNIKYETAQIDEFWAYKIAEYGDARLRDYPELKIEPQDCILKHTRFFFQSNETEVTDNSVTYINNLDDNRWFSIDDLNQNIHFDSQIIGAKKSYSSERYGYDLTQYNDTLVYDYEDFNVINDEFTIFVSKPNQIVQLPFLSDELIAYPDTFTQLSSSVVRCHEIGHYSFRGYIPLKPKFSPIKLFDYKSNVHIEDISVWHPAFGIHAPETFDVINICNNIDPANYNYSLLTFNNINYNPLKIWGDKEVGLIWWDTNNNDYIPYYDKFIFPNFEERLSRWGSLAEYASINLYEWIKSDVHPSLYNDAVILEQGNTNIASEVRKTGSIANQDLYKRTRQWQGRTIAWSYVPNPSEDHPLQMFNYGVDKIYLSTTSIGSATIIFEHGTLEQYSLTTDMSISGWLFNKPIGEFIIGSTSGFFYGSSIDLGSENQYSFSGLTVFSTIKVLQNSDFLGKKVVGHILIYKNIIDDVVHLTAEEELSGRKQSLIVVDNYEPIGSEIKYNFNELGFQLIGYSKDQLNGIDIIASEFEACLDLTIRQYCNGTIVIPFDVAILNNELPIEPITTYSNILSITGVNYIIDATITLTSNTIIGNYLLSFITENNISYLILSRDNVELQRIDISTLQIIDNKLLINFDFFSIECNVDSIDLEKVIKEIILLSSITVSYNTSSALSFESSEIISTYNWRAWKTPTQDDLDVDTSTPYTNWTAIYGDWINLPHTKDVLSMIDTYQKSKLVTLSGEIIEKYNSDWSEWVKLKDEYQHKISEGSIVNFNFDRKIDANYFSLYVNGMNQLKSTYLIDDKYPKDIVTLNEITAGHKVTALLRRYKPSDTELNFDPEVSDNIYTLEQYKYDYEYVVKDTRDDYGNISGKIYYFWVKHKLIPKVKKEMSCQQAETLLKNGPDVYMTFQEFKDTYYKAITIANLNRFIKKENTFKLRFTRNFTLRDDPQEIDLKNVHTEWVLIRPNDSKKIPRQLWEKIIDSACGKTISGKIIPTNVRVEYDIRHGTKTRYGFGPDQIMIDKVLVKNSLIQAITNPVTKKFFNGQTLPDLINNLDMSTISEQFETPEKTRQLLEFIWTNATAQQLNGIFFEVLGDALSNDYEFSELFKTSRLSAHSIKTINSEYNV